MRGDVSKLPKWAQAELRNTARERDEWKKLALEGPENTNTAVRSLMGEIKPLERGSRIRFQLGERWDEYVECYVEDRIGGPILAVHGGRPYVIHPHSGNLVFVTIPDRN